VIGVDGSARAIAEQIAEIESLGERVHTGAVGCVHRMQRGSIASGTPDARQDGRDAIGYHLPGRLELKVRLKPVSR
jgi:hypothetical protein